ncbi:MAG: MFS transporter, partial [Pseudomonas sp. PGPPP3]
MNGARATQVTLLTLFLVNFLNFFDRVLPAVVLEPLRKEFMLSDTMLGLLGTAFVLVYAVAGIPLGRLADKTKRTRLLSVGVFVWSLFTAAGGAVSNFTTMFLLRLGVGIGEAACAPAANSMIGDLYP